MALETYAKAAVGVETSSQGFGNKPAASVCSQGTAAEMVTAACSDPWHSCLGVAELTNDPSSENMCSSLSGTCRAGRHHASLSASGASSQAPDKPHHDSLRPSSSCESQLCASQIDAHSELSDIGPDAAADGICVVGVSVQRPSREESFEREVPPALAEDDEEVEFRITVARTFIHAVPLCSPSFSSARCRSMSMTSRP